MNYRLGFFILALVIGGLITYMVFKPSKQTDPIQVFKEEKKLDKKAAESDVTRLENETKLIQDEKIKVNAVYDTIGKRQLVNRADSLYRYGMRRGR